MKHRILIIEDDEIMRITLEDALISHGYEVVAAAKGSEGIRAVREDDFCLVVTDVLLPDVQGPDVLKAVREVNAGIPVLIITAFGTIKDAVEAMKMGAYDYITKPFSLEEFGIIVKRALEMRDLRKENARLRKDLSECYQYPILVGESPRMRNILELIEKVSRTDSTVLILGESGTGKELLARMIHYHSSRREGPLIQVNCAAFPEHLVESELFGYEKGAFTGALRRKLGRFELADKGTIFLDEIGDLQPSVQIKLLRVLQDRSFERLGGTERLYVDVRIIAATNKNIEDAVGKGAFREDLYYRLNVIPVSVPPLRERSEDIPELIRHFLDRYNERFEKKVSLHADAVKTLMEYDFPGNVRELENIVQRCVALAENGELGVQALPVHIVRKQAGIPVVGSLSEIAAEAEKAHILRILKATGGNRKKAAEILGITRKTLWEKVKGYYIDPD